MDNFSTKRGEEKFRTTLPIFIFICIFSPCKNKGFWKLRRRSDGFYLLISFSSGMLEVGVLSEKEVLGF